MEQTVIREIPNSNMVERFVPRDCPTSNYDVDVYEMFSVVKSNCTGRIVNSIVVDRYHIHGQKLVRHMGEHMVCKWLVDDCGIPLKARGKRSMFNAIVREHKRVLKEEQ